MTDREMLELAAKAAGMELDYTIRPDKKAFYHSERNAFALADGGWFAPLADDGDAFRMAVKLKFDILQHKESVNIIGVYQRLPKSIVTQQPAGDDPLAATRRAIVRAAAEIGRQIK